MIFFGAERLRFFLVLRGCGIFFGAKRLRDFLTVPRGCQICCWC